jgi:iron complex outermembrane receptor protein
MAVRASAEVMHSFLQGETVPKGNIASSRAIRLRSSGLLAVWFWVLPGQAGGQSSQPSSQQSSQQASPTLPASQTSPASVRGDLTTVSLEDLMNIEVTSVSKKEQKLSRTAAAVFVITQEDIQRSGATNIPDLLRMVPGLQVAQINGDNWAITARGFDGQYSNKLLVLIDGRTAYSPILSGVYWNAEDVPLHTIERIEVIRGPGAAVWGANAVNGVINITTFKAGSTQGGLLSAGVGSYEQGFGSLRYGGTIGNETAYRVVAGGFNRGPLTSLDGQNGEDDWDSFHGGFRVDAQASPKDSLTLEGDAYQASAGELVSSIVSIAPPTNGVLQLRDHFSGWDVVSRWNHKVSENSETSLQIYFDRDSRGDGTYATGLNTFDIDFQDHVGCGSRQDFVWGAGYRRTSDAIGETLRIEFNPAKLSQQLFSSFVQDEIVIKPDRLYLTLGTKLEHNEYTGLGWQPTVRIAWTVNERNMFWAAISRALRTPTQTDRSIRVNYLALPGPDGLPLLVSAFGNPDQQNEREDAYEAGYRTELGKRFSFDGTAFFNKYNGLTSEEPGAPFLEADPPPLHLVVPIVFGNLLYGETHGVELSMNWKVTSRWTLSPGYTFLTMHLHQEARSEDSTTIPGTQGQFPSQQAQLRSHVDLRSEWQWNTSAYFVGALPAVGVPSYTRLDSNVKWQPWERVSLSLVGQNLLRDHHLEYLGPDQTEQSSLIKRSVYVKVVWSF